MAKFEKTGIPTVTYEEWQTELQFIQTGIKTGKLSLAAARKCYAEALQKSRREAAEKCAHLGEHNPFRRYLPGQQPRARL